MVAAIHEIQRENCRDHKSHAINRPEGRRAVQRKYSSVLAAAS